MLLLCQNLRSFHFAKDFTLPTSLYTIWYVQVEVNYSSCLTVDSSLFRSTVAGKGAHTSSDLPVVLVNPLVKLICNQLSSKFEIASKVQNEKAASGFPNCACLMKSFLWFYIWESLSSPSLTKEDKTLVEH